jgi:N-acetylglucosamine kinase-like BadF-type ATPase
MQVEISALLPVPLKVVNDAFPLGPVVGRPDSIGLVVGTGSIAVGRDDSGAGIYVGGWSWLVSDDGGAAGLVREAVRAVLRARDVSQRDVVLAAEAGSTPAVVDVAPVSGALSMAHELAAAVVP